MKRVYSLIYFLFLFLSFNIFSYDLLPEAFGKTHFIVGVDSQKIIENSKKKHASNIENLLETTEHGIKHVLFAPDDKVLDILKQLIKREKASIRMAAFLLTDYQIVKAVIAAKARGVIVEIVLDSRGLNGRYGKTARLLKSRGIDVFVYKISQKVPAYLSNIMHNKFIVFGENVFDRSLIWTGSFNFTYSAHRVNQENVVILDDIAIIKKFINRFNYMKDNLCYVLKNNNGGSKKSMRKKKNKKKRA